MAQRTVAPGSRQAPDPHDQFLEKMGFYRKHTGRDSSNLFRVISEQLYDTQKHHGHLREECVTYMRRYRDIFKESVDGDFDNYLMDLSKARTYGSLLELRALAACYRNSDADVLLDTTTGLSTGHSDGHFCGSPNAIDTLCWPGYVRNATSNLPTGATQGNGWWQWDGDGQLLAPQWTAGCCCWRRGCRWGRSAEEQRGCHPLLRHSATQPIPVPAAATHQCTTHQSTPGKLVSDHISSTTTDPNDGGVT